MRRRQTNIKKLIQKKIEMDNRRIKYIQKRTSDGIKVEKKPVVSGRKVVEKTKTVKETPQKINKKPTEDVDMNDRMKRRLGIQTEPMNVDLVKPNKSKLINNDVVSNLITIEKRQPISIIVTAYQTQNYIEECLDSIEKQTYFDGFNNYEVLVGVDGCEKTLNKLLEIRHKYRNLRIFMMDKNMGTYITSNTLIDLCTSDNIIRFDSDDIMMKYMVRSIMLNKKNNDIIIFSYHGFRDSIKMKLKPKYKYAGGVIYFRKSVMDLAGGYMPWKCSADTEFLRRVKSKIKLFHLKNKLFYRRYHSQSLTTNPETSMNSELRNEYKKQIRYYKRNEEIKIKRITNTYKEYKMKIPKIIHQIWIGPNPKPVFMDTWKKNHPDYEYILWDEKKIKEELYPIKNQHLYDLYDNEDRNVWNGRANLLRYEILYKYGGIYVDADAISLRPLEGDFLDSDFFIIYANEKVRGDRLNNCFIGSAPNHIVMESAINELNKHKELEQPSFVFSGPVFITDLIKKLNVDVVKLPSYYFSPQFYNNINNPHYTGKFKPFANHIWGTTKNLYTRI